MYTFTNYREEEESLILSIFHWFPNPYDKIDIKDGDNKCFYHSLKIINVTWFVVNQACHYYIFNLPST